MEREEKIGNKKGRKKGNWKENKTLLTVCSGLRVIGSKTKPC